VVSSPAGPPTRVGHHGRDTAYALPPQDVPRAASGSSRLRHLRASTLVRLWGTSLSRDGHGAIADSSVMRLGSVLASIEEHGDGGGVGKLDFRRTTVAFTFGSADGGDCLHRSPGLPSNVGPRARAGS